MNHRLHPVAVSLFLSLGAAGCVHTYCPSPDGATAGPPAAAKPAAPAPPSRVAEPRHIYRIDYVVSSVEPGKSPSSSAYSLNVEDERGGEVHIGTNVPLNAQARQDVGLKLKGHLEEVGDDLILRSVAEISALEEPSTIRKITADSDTVLKGTQPVLVASLEDPTSHRKYQVTASATKLR